MRSYNQFLKLSIFICIIQSQIHPSHSKETLYYGFFFDASTASSIKELTDYYLNTSMTQLQAFSEFLEASADFHNVTSPFQYFSKPADPNTQDFDPYYHVTTKYCGDGIDCTSYAQEVSASLNKNFEMELIGLYFTNRTFGIRVKLTAEQEKLFDNNSRASSNSFLLPSTNSGGGSLSNGISASFPGLSFLPQAQDFPPSTNKPHITIGCAPGIPAVTTGTDLLEIIQYETSFSTTLHLNFTISVSIDGAAYNDTVIQYQNQTTTTTAAFVIYPQMKIIANATFQPYFLPDTSTASTAVFHARLLVISVMFSIISTLGLRNLIYFQDLFLHDTHY